MPVVDLLQVRGLTVQYPGASRPAIADLDLDVVAGECVALVGPSGCGKSTLCRALLDLLPAGTDRRGTIVWQGRDLTLDPQDWRRVRGAGMGLVLQDHRHALDPVRRVGDQVAEVVRRHRSGCTSAQAHAAADDLLDEVRLSAADHARRYPHQLSGGQRQRVCLAASLAADPQLLLADEPTTALDLMVQRDIASLLVDLVRRRGLSLVLVSHDRDLVSLLADRVVDLAGDPPPGEIPGADHGNRDVAPPETRLAVRGLTVTVAGPRGPSTVVAGVDLDLVGGRTLGLVGESGAGKTTLARALAGWLPRAAGEVRLTGGTAVTGPALRRAVQLVSQDPAAALDPRQTAGAAVIEAARAAGLDRDEAVRDAAERLAEVDLAPALADRLPGELSGGQRQRLQLARALAARPRVLVADEPASSLDPVRRDALLELMRRSQQRHAVALMIISHDLSLLVRWCDEIVVMLAGHLVELYRPGLVDGPRHPFARDLAAATPAKLSRLHGFESTLVGRPETNQQPPPNGCPYASRCDLVQPTCLTALPALLDLGEGHLVRCPETDRQVR